MTVLIGTYFISASYPELLHAAARLLPEQFLYRARRLRRELRRRGILHAPVLWAPGETEKPAETGEAPPQGRRSIPGSVSWVPASAGLRMAEHVVLSLTGLA